MTATGFVETVEARDRGARLVLRVTGMDGVAPDARPERVRVSLRLRKHGSDAYYGQR